MHISLYVVLFGTAHRKKTTIYQTSNQKSSILLPHLQGGNNILNLII